MIPETLVGLIITLSLGSYLYTTGSWLFLFRWAERKFERWEKNHLKHAEKAINEVRSHLGLPPVSLREDK